MILSTSHLESEENFYFSTLDEMALLKSFLNTSSDLVFLKDKDFRHLFANTALCNFFGKTNGEVIGKTDYELMPMEAAENCRATDLKVLNEKRVITTEEIIGNKYFETRKFLVVYLENQQGIGGFIRDVTEQRQAEEALRKSKEKAEESDRLKTAFLQNMSHEIRTPLNAIMGFSDLIINYHNNKPKLEHFTGIINQRCADLLKVINEILDIAKIESGMLPVHFEVCNIQTLFSEIHEFFNEYRQKINKQHIEFNITIHFDR